MALLYALPQPYALILAGGDLHLIPQTQAPLCALALGASMCVAADGGVRHAPVLGVTPDILVGDFDSATPEALQSFAHVRKDTHPRHKDQLDLELALHHALTQRPAHIAVLGALGDRVDQSLAAIFIAAHLAPSQSISLHSGRQDVYVLYGHHHDVSQYLTLPPKTTFSLLSLSASTTVSIEGAAYALKRAHLHFGTGVGVSNQTRDPEVHITLHPSGDKETLIIIIEH